MTEKRIQRLWIANRGEIARRIAVTCCELGIETSCLMDQTLGLQFLRPLITHPVYGSSFERSVYLDINAQIEFAKNAHCDSIHPGFGFLSESAEFAQAVVDAGLVWVGPSPDAITAMASKENARDLAKKAGVPISEGIQNVDPTHKNYSYDSLKAKVESIGFPVLVKAAYGGGGKGMRRVDSEKDLSNAVERCHSEAIRSFGNGSLIVERYIEHSRHVEVQVFGDGQGDAVCVGDRDCSLQRRHQKIIEEAPAPFLDEHVRIAMHETALQLTKNVGYASAGTVEYLLETKDGQQSFFFLEMNTRLQVEHPVSEEVFGVDLVEWQLRLASGESLESIIPPLERPLQPIGHSIEVRLYGEDPTQDFLPTAGPCVWFNPDETQGIRWEIGIDSRDIISSEFDPMFSKAVIHAENRQMAIQRLSKGLERSCFFGVETNLEFLSQLLCHPKFIQGELATSFLTENTLDVNSSSLSPESLKEIESQIHSLRYEYTCPDDLECFAKILSSHSSVQITPEDFSELPADEHQVTLAAAFVLEGTLSAPTLSGSPRFLAAINSDKFWIKTEGNLHVQAREISELNDFNFQTTGDNAGVSPVPGKVIRVSVKKGTEVHAGDTILVLESMKMEFEIKAEVDGKLEEVFVAEGSQVAADDALFEIVPLET